MPWGLTLSLSPPCWKENLWYSFQQVCQKRTKVCPTKKLSLPLVEKKIFDILFNKYVEKMFVKAVQICLQILSTIIYIQICGLSIESVTKICQTNVHQFVTKSAQNLSLKSVHKRIHESVNNLSLFWKQFVTILEPICHYSAFRSSQIHFVLSRIMSVHTSTNLSIKSWDNGQNLLSRIFLQKINLKH